MSDGARALRSLRRHARRHRGQLALLLLLVIALALFFTLGGQRWLSLDTLHQHRAELIAFAQSHRVGAIVLALAIYTAVIGLSVPGAFVLSLASGLVFGRWLGTAVAIVGETAGATIIFVAARYLFAEAAHRRLGAHGRRMAAGFAKHAWSYMLFLRLVPLFPFVLVNLASALAPIPLSTYVLATAIGIVPATFIYVNLGHALGRAESAGELLSPEVLLALTLLGVLALTPIVVARLRARAGV